MAGIFTTTARNGLRKLAGTSKVSDIDEGFQALADDVDQKMASYSEGATGARPAAGQSNRFWKDTTTGILYHDTGAEWEQLIVAAQNGAHQAINTGNAYTNKKYSKAEAEAGVKPSATRAALVVLSASAGLSAASVDGVEVVETGGVWKNVTFLVRPGGTWKANEAVFAATVLL
jgi:hypothetical protein